MRNKCTMSYSLPRTVSKTNQKWNPFLTLCPILVSETHFQLGEVYVPRLSLQNEGRREPGNILRKSCRLLAPCCGGTNQIAECIVLTTESVFQLPCSLKGKLQPFKGCVLLLLHCTITFTRLSDIHMHGNAFEYSLLDCQKVVRPKPD